MAKFLIAGAGIAGLSAAIALSRSGHQATVLEQAPELSEVGAGIQLGPNAMRILMGWGLGETLQELGCKPFQFVVRDARDDSVLTSRPLNDRGEGQQQDGAPHLCIRRADLQSVLLKAALDTGANVLLGQTVEGLHESRLENFDALLGCDGLHSKVREEMLAGTQHAGKPRDAGHTAYRAMIDMALLPLELRDLSVQVWLGEHQHVVAYPVNHQTLNVVIAQEQLPALAHPNATPFPAHVHALIAAIEANGGFTTWQLFHRPPMLAPQFYAKGNVALLGDAAHPLLPYVAQGAAMAIEDAQALALACAGVESQLNDGSQAKLHMALHTYGKARWMRNARVQWQSSINGHVFHAGGLLRLARDAVLKVAGRQVTAMRWLYDYQNASIKHS